MMADHAFRASDTLAVFRVLWGQYAHLRYTITAVAGSLDMSVGHRQLSRLQPHA